MSTKMLLFKWLSKNYLLINTLSTATSVASVLVPGMVSAAVAATLIAVPFLSQENAAKKLDEKIQFKPKEIDTVLNSFLWGNIAAGVAVIGSELYTQKRFQRYKQKPLQKSNVVDSDSNTSQPAKTDQTFENKNKYLNAPSPVIRLSYPENQSIAKTWQVLLVPEGYDTETLQNPDFRRGVERYQAFLQAHFPKHLVSVGIAWPDGFFDTTRPSEKFSRTFSENHPFLRSADAVVTLWNTEDKRLWEHAYAVKSAAITRGPTPQGKSDLEMLLTLLHETLHLIPVKEMRFKIYDSYEYEFVPYYKTNINDFFHTGFLPDLPKEDWRDTHVTDAVRHYQVPLVPYSQDGQNYLALDNRTHIMDDQRAVSQPIQQIAFGLTGGKMIPAYLEYIVKQNLTDWLEKKGRINPEEATTLREQYALGAPQVMSQSTFFYLKAIFERG